MRITHHLLNLLYFREQLRSTPAIHAPRCDVQRTKERCDREMDRIEDEIEKGQK